MNKKRDAFRVFPLLSSVVPLSFSIDHPPTVQRLSFSVNQSPQVCGESFLFSSPLVVFPCFFQTISTVSFLLYRLLLTHLPLFVHLLFHVWHSYFLCPSTSSPGCAIFPPLSTTFQLRHLSFLVHQLLCLAVLPSPWCHYFSLLHLPYLSFSFNNSVLQPPSPSR